MSAVTDRIYEAAPPALKRVLMDVYAAYLHYVREGAPMDAAIDDLERIDRQDRREVESLQLERLNELLAWSDARVPYYRGRLLVGSGPQGRLASLAELDRLPILTKHDVRANAHAMTAPGVKKHYGHTSGTTGTPVQLWYDRGQRIWNRAAEKVVRRRAGIAPDERVAMIWGRAIVPRTAKRPPFWMINDTDREIWLSAFHVGRGTARLYFDAIRAYKAVALETYPSLAYILARLALDSGERLRLKRVLTSSETLYPFQRETIQEAFGAEVFDFYGAAERVTFGIECRRHEGLHLLEAFGVVEPSTGGPNDGFLATGLTNRSMPLIRYHVTDVTQVIDTPCGCGLTSRRLAPIATKREDLVVTPDGRFVSPSVLTHPFKPLKGLVRSQIVQERIDALTVKLETGPGWIPEQLVDLRRALEDRMGAGVTIDIVEAPVQSERSGKFRWVISHVKGEHQVTERSEQRAR